jgi:hypothetical protein
MPDAARFTPIGIASALPPRSSTAEDRRSRIGCRRQNQL